MGYKKHSLRLWLNGYEPSVRLVPVVSWVAPANRNDVELLLPSVRYCAHQLDWVPDYLVGDKGYIDLKAQRRIREQWGVGVVTRIRIDMKLVPPFESDRRAICPQGQTLNWLGYEPADDLHWFGVTEAEPLCPWCWHQRTCPRQFGHHPLEHEILFGLLPLVSRPAQRLLSQVRPWIEASQSYEKNQLGLGVMFFNSLRFCWYMCLLADAVLLLRSHALCLRPAAAPPLYELTPQQMELGLKSDQAS